MDFRDHLFTPHPIEELNEGAAEKIKGFLNRVSKPKHNVISYDPNMIEYQKAYSLHNHQLYNPSNKEHYAKDKMKQRGINMTPAMQKMASIVKHDDILKHPGSW